MLFQHELRPQRGLEGELRAQAPRSIVTYSTFSLRVVVLVSHAGVLAQNIGHLGYAIRKEFSIVTTCHLLNSKERPAVFDLREPLRVRGYCCGYNAPQWV